MTDTDRASDLPEHTCWTLLRSAAVARLAVSVDGAPDIFPINIVVDHGTIVFRTAEGTKLSGALSGPVAVEADGYDSQTSEAWSVVVKGRATELKRLHELVESVDLPLSPWHGAPKRRFLRVIPDEVSGRRFPVVNMLAWATPLTGARRSSAE